MRLPLILLLFTFCSVAVQAQTIKLLDKQTKTPVINAALYNNARSTYVVSDEEGKADVSAFTKSETIFITHVSHITLKTTKAAIVSQGNVVYLEDNENQLNEVVLSVSKFEQESKDIAQKIVSLDAEDVEMKNPQTAADFLSQSGQVFVQKSQLGGGSPMIRGF